MPYSSVSRKLLAPRCRGNNDPLGSHDMEDILNIFDGRTEIVGEIAAADSQLRRYIADQVGALLGHEAFAYAVQSTARGDKGREALIFRRLEAVHNMAQIR